MKKQINFSVIALASGLALLATAGANAKPFGNPGYQPISPANQPINNFKQPIYQPVNPGNQLIGKGPIWNPAKNPCTGNGWCNPNGSGYGPAYYSAGLAVGVGLASIRSASVDDSDCYYVRRRVFVPGVGIVRKRELVCD